MALQVYEYVQLTGTIIPDTAVTRQQVEQEYKNAFGDDLIVTPNTPQGMLITAETLARDAAARNNAALANQINPNIAGGVYLDALLALTGSQRNAAAYSTVLCDLTGIAGTPIPAGVTAKTAAGDIFQSITTVTLDGSGEASVTFQAIDPGAIVANAGTLTIIVDGVLGWETVTNPDDATLGSDTQTDEAARIYRRNTLALQGQSLAEAITSGLYATPGVRSVTFRENVEDDTQVIDGVTLVGHSMYACVDGGTDNAVAATILQKKSGGCNYNGDTVVNVIEPASGQTFPVRFDRPDLIPVLIRVTIRSNTSVADPVGTVNAAILAYADGLLDNEPGFVVGAPVSPFELSGAINREAPTIFVTKVEVSYSSPIDFVTTELPIQIFEKATIIQSSITVVIV